MNSLRSLFSALIAALLFLASTGCEGPSGSDGSPPGFGAWIIGESTGEITYTESGGFCSGSWVFCAEAESDSNLVRVIGSAKASLWSLLEPVCHCNIAAKSPLGHTCGRFAAEDSVVTQ